MSLKQAFASILYLFVLSVFFGAGLFLIAAAYLPQIQVLAIDFFTHRTQDLSLLGLALLSLTFLLFLGFHALNPGRYLHLKMGNHTAVIDRKVVQKAVEDVFKDRKISLKGIDLISGTKLEIGVQVDPMDEAEQDELLLNVEKELQLLLQQRFGYTKPFYLVLKV